MAEITISPMTERDVDAVHAIECASFSVPWSRESLLKEATENACARYLVLREDGEPIAYAGMWLVIDECHITNIAVRPDRRGMGYGEAILRALIQLAADSGGAMLTLEVRRSNAAAISLYTKLGFFRVGVRKGYYADTKEDALLLLLDKLPPGDPERDPWLVREPDDEHVEE